MWNLPPRNAAFTGRESILAALRHALLAGGPAVVQAIYGMGGVGKTSLAAEYCYRFASHYKLVWWVSAEQVELINEQLATLGVEAGWVAADAPTSTAAAEVRRQLRACNDWLIVFDDAEDPDQTLPFLPQGLGHVIITSRNSHWGRVAASAEVDVFARDESVSLLRRSIPHLKEIEAAEIAEAVGDLPLAVAQAGNVLADTGLPAEEYLQLLNERAGEVLAEGRPWGYPRPLAAAVRVAVDRLAQTNEAAAQLLQLCAFLAPAPVPTELFTAAPPGALPEPLSSAATRPLAMARTISNIGTLGLARVEPGGLTLHRLTQAVLRDHHASDWRVVIGRVEDLLAAARPDDALNPLYWPRWARLLPHLLAADVANTTNPGLRDAAWLAAGYLTARGEPQIGRALAERLHQAWRATLGDDHPDTQAAATTLAYALRALGEHQWARQLDEDSLARRSRLLGSDHPHALASATNLAATLRAIGEFEQARRLSEDALARYRRVLGDDHPDTLRSVNNLAVTLSDLGEHEQARQLQEDILARRRRVLGDDHPHTLASANNLAATLRAIGEFEQARRLSEDALARYRRVLGDDHPDTLRSVNNLAVTLSELGEHEQARQLQEDILARRRRVLGDDHPHTLASANNLAATLRAIGEFEQARRLSEDALARYRRVLG
ncbi:FxSxx-COOH system tetratricopeptide repeat protein, partial [Micromonospora purpureochromogenes]|uniref:FxSxx-COOH system tetratricopeptide repeat protein n=1 Tax=Micromonospora purpureochromogenes TaxID=47872 RepID=UPI00340995F9